MSTLNVSQITKTKNFFAENEELVKAEAANIELSIEWAKLAAKIMYADEDAATIKEKAAEYKELQSSPMAAARRGYVDTIIAPADTRKYLIGAFEMLFTKREERPSKKHGTV